MTTESWISCGSLPPCQLHASPLAEPHTCKWHNRKGETAAARSVICWQCGSHRAVHEAARRPPEPLHAPVDVMATPVTHWFFTCSPAWGGEDAVPPPTVLSLSRPQPPCPASVVATACRRPPPRRGRCGHCVVADAAWWPAGGRWGSRGRRGFPAGTQRPPRRTLFSGRSALVRARQPPARRVQNAGQRLSRRSRP